MGANLPNFSDIRSPFALFRYLVALATDVQGLDSGSGATPLATPSTVASRDVSAGSAFATLTCTGLKTSAATCLRIDSTGATYRTDTVSATGACTYSHAAAVTGITESQAQATAGVGVTRTIQAQRGFAGSAGGIMRIAGGAGGTLGTDAAGDVQIECGTTVGGTTSKVTLTSGAFANPFLDMYLFGGYAAIYSNAAAATAGMLLNTSGAFGITAGSVVNITTASGVSLIGNAFFESAGQMSNAPQALATTGAVAWDANAKGGNAFILATGNCVVTITNSRSGGSYELEFVPQTTKTLSLPSPIVYPTATYSDAALVTLCATATRIIVKLKNKRGVLYVDSYTGYSA